MGVAMNRTRIPLARAGIALFLGLACTSTVRSDIVFTPDRVDLGEIRAGVPISQRFAFTNHGPEAVTIRDMRGSCGCLAPKLAKRDYAPGEKGELTVEINSLSQPSGPHSWRVQVFYQTGAEPHEKTLTLQAQLLHEIEVRPAALQVFVSSAVQHEITLTDLRTRPLLVTSIEGSTPHLQARVSETTRDAAGHTVYKIQVQVKDNLPEGRHEVALHLYTDDPLYRELKLPATLVKRSPQRVHAAPCSVSLVAGRGQTLVSRLVVLRAADEADVQIEKAEGDHPAVTCEWSRDAGPAATVRVTVDAVGLTGSGLRGQVKVQLSKPTREVLVIPWSCLGP
jgi:hypothetical protein